MQNKLKEASDMEQIIKVDIAIAGAGMVGAALAAALRGSRYKIAIIDAQSEPSLLRALQSSSDVHSFEPRVSALTQASQNLLRQTGAWDLIPESLRQTYRKMKVWDELGTAQICFDAAEIYHDALGCIVENQAIVSALQVRLREQTNIVPFYGSGIAAIRRLPDTQAEHEITLETGQKLQCQLLIGADGAGSRVRQWAGIPTREWDYQHEAIVCTVETENVHEDTAWQRFSESGPLAFLPLSDATASKRFCSIVWSQVTERARHLMTLDDKAFSSALELAIEARLGQVVSVSRRFSFPLRQRHAKAYVKPGLVLVGDAAHTIHPLAGQGVNLGFKDVAVLADILRSAEAQALDVNDLLLLKRYQRQRQGDNLLMMGAMEGFKRLFSAQDPKLRWLRNAGLDWVNKQSFLKNEIARHAMGLSL